MTIAFTFSNKLSSLFQEKLHLNYLYLFSVKYYTVFVEVLHFLTCLFFVKQKSKILAGKKMQIIAFFKKKKMQMSHVFDTHYYCSLVQSFNELLKTQNMVVQFLFFIIQKVTDKSLNIKLSKQNEVMSMDLSGLLVLLVKPIYANKGFRFQASLC